MAQSIDLGANTFLDITALAMDYEDVTISTGSTTFQDMYYGDATPTKATRNKCVCMFVYNVANSRPAYIQWTDNTTLRAYTTAASSSVMARVYYKKP